MPKLHLEKRALGFVCLLFTALGWALNFTSIKFLIREWPPLFSRGLAGVISSIILAIVANRRGERIGLSPAELPRVLFASFTNVLAWMGFSTLSLKWLGVGESLLLCYTMPIWSTLLAWPLLGSRPTIQGVVALTLGIGGIVVLLSGQDVSFDAGQLWGVLLALSAAMFFALGAVLNARPMPIPPIASTAWQVGLGCVPLLLVGLFIEHPTVGALTTGGVWIMAYMTVIAMGVCYLTWFAAVRLLSPSTAATGMLLVPVFGASSAAVALGEPFGVRQVSALLLTLSGVGISLRAKPVSSKVARSQNP